MAGEKPSKWEQKQAAAKAAEAKFDANQRLAKHRAKQGRKGKGVTTELDDVGSSLGNVLDDSPGVLGRMVAHRKLLLGIGGVLLAGGIIFGMCMVQRHQLRTAPGSPRQELFVAGNPATLIVIEYVAVGGTNSKGMSQPASAKGQRLTAIDADTGAQLAVSVGDYQKCWAGNGRVVCVDVYDRVDLLDPRTLDVTHEANDLIAKANLAKPTRRYEREGNDVVVVLEDGRGARIDTGTLAVTVIESVQSGFARSESESCDTENNFKQDNVMWVFTGGGTREKLTSNPPPPSESATPSGPALTYLHPGFLRTDPPQPIVLHAATTEKRYSLVSRVDGISKETWQAPLDGQCRRAWVSGPLLIIATDNPARRAVALYLNSGQVAWTFGR
ncbi:MAG: hypothetical protein H0V17_29200 [Deltaproteobacteria bacterium]|nr:hypothetical protein [Deltaproteobacteria bacterium]